MALIDDLKIDLYAKEDKRPFLYDDATGQTLSSGMEIKGNPTIGVGRNLSKRPLSDREIDFLLDNDCADVIEWCKTNLNWFASSTVNQQRAISNMVFQNGESGFLKYHNMIDKIKANDWAGAKVEALNSEWARQTPNRASFVTGLFTA